MSKFVVLEGVDGSGKSSTAALLAESMGAALYQTPPKQFRKIREKVDAEASDYDHYLFYKRAVEIASEEIGEILQGGNLVVCDRYWLTTVVYHQVMGVTVSQNDFCSLLQPDHTFFLSVSESVQVQRLNARGLSAGDKRMLDRQQALRSAYMESLNWFAGKVDIINTDSLSQNQTVGRILGLLR